MLKKNEKLPAIYSQKGIEKWQSFLHDIRSSNISVNTSKYSARKNEAQKIYFYKKPTLIVYDIELYYNNINKICKKIREVKIHQI